MNTNKALTAIRMQLAETGGVTSQELGAGRIVGQVLMHLYLQKDVQSLDDISDALSLSKASISIAVRQLEQLGFVRRVWVKGDRKKYYRSADNIGNSLQQGFLAFLRNKLDFFGAELNSALTLLEGLSAEEKTSEDYIFLQQRMNRAKKLQGILLKILGNPLVDFLTKNIK